MKISKWGVINKILFFGISLFFLSNSLIFAYTLDEYCALKPGNKWEYSGLEGEQGDKQTMIVESREKIDNTETVKLVFSDKGNTSFKFRVSNFSNPATQITDFIETLAKELNLTVPAFESLQQAIVWLNETTVPYQIFINYMSESELGATGEGLLGKIKTDYNKDLKDFTDSELKELAVTYEGEHLKRLILLKRYPLKTPESQDYGYLIIDAEGVREYKKFNEGEWTVFNPPKTLFPADMKVGESRDYVQEAERFNSQDEKFEQQMQRRKVLLERIEDVIVPAGEFKDCLKFVIVTKCSTINSNEEINCSIWWARGAGKIKQVWFSTEYNTETKERSVSNGLCELSSAVIDGKIIAAADVSQ